MRPRGKDWALIAIAIAFASLCARLGIWQLDRLGQRRARNAIVAASRSQPAVAIARAVTAAEAESLRDRPVTTQGVFDYAHERVWPGRSYEGTPGVAIVTPLRLPDGSFVFVDRGWVSSPDGMHIELRNYHEGDTVSIIGVGQVPPRGRGDVDPARLRDSLAGPVAPLVIRQLPDGGLSSVRRWPEPKLTNGPHLGYAIQWFSFAVITLVGTTLLLRTARKNAAANPGASPRG